MVRPILQLLTDLLKSLEIILGELDSLPKVLRRMRSLNCFHVQPAHALLFQDCSVLAVREWAGDAVAEARDVVLVLTEVLLGLRELHPERAEVVVDAVPDGLVVVHASAIEGKPILFL